MRHIVLSTMLVALLAGCKKGPIDPEPKSCEDHGGQRETFETSEGPKEMCRMPDGSRCMPAELPGPCACLECPAYSPPSPDFCKDGTIIPGGVNECGCQQPPGCEAGPTAPE